MFGYQLYCKSLIFFFFFNYCILFCDKTIIMSDKTRTRFTKSVDKYSIDIHGNMLSDERILGNPVSRFLRSIQL